MHGTIGELLIQTCITTFLIRHFVCNTDVIRIKQLLYYQGFLFCALELDVRCDWQAMAPSTHRSLFLISHLCILYSLDQTPRLVFISAINFVQLLFESGVYLTQWKMFCKYMNKGLGVLQHQQWINKRWLGFGAKLPAPSSVVATRQSGT